MTRQPAVTAARRVLDTGPDILLTELAAWLIGAAGEEVPNPSNPAAALHARLAAAAGAGDIDAVTAVLEGGLPLEQGALLLRSACELIGPSFPDTLVEVARRHPGRPFVGRMLARTSDPGGLLALLPGDPPGSQSVATVAELVISGRDRGNPVPAAEDRWADIVRKRPAHLEVFRDALLRVAVRDSLEAGVALLGRLADEWGRDWIVDGARAVLSRLVRVDPNRAAALVGATSDPAGRVAWLDGLAWWLELAPAALPIVHGLLDRGDADLDLALARVLARTPEVGLLDLALRSAGSHEPDTLARALAPGVYQLRAGGRHEVATRVRRRCLAVLPGPAADVFEVIAGPGPALVPWATAVGAP